MAMIKKKATKIGVRDGKKNEILSTPPRKKEKSPVRANGKLSKLPKTKFPHTIKPMLATLVDAAFDKEGWLYEIKWDGYRAIAYLNNGMVTLKSRNDKSFNEKFYPIIDSLKKWEINAIVDGEVVVLNQHGISDFAALQNWRSEADGALHFYVFDMLWLDGTNLTGMPLLQRRELLEANMPKDSLIRLSNSFTASGIEFFEAAKKMGLEGIIAKKTDSLYEPGARSKEWLKIKANKRQEMVIGGYTKNDESSKLFSALLVGVFEKNKLVYTGKVGTGFSEKLQREMIKLFKKNVSKSCPFTEIPDINKPSRFRPNPPHAKATWLKPLLVCEVSFAEMTKDGVMRHPSFEGMRTDKAAKKVIIEKAGNTPQLLKTGTLMSEHKMLRPGLNKERKTLLNPTDETQVRKVNGHELKFTNLHKFYWKKEKITKRDLLNYYYQVAPYILPYLKDRPQSMLRHPDGIDGESFFFKDVTGKAPSWVETYLYRSDADDRDRNYLVAKDEASLLYMASLGCIEMNPWNSRVQSEDYPDWCIIDLDPAKNSFDQVVEAALVTKDVLDSFDIASYPKTSGSTGMHIYIPLGAKYTYAQSKEFARVIARLVNEKLPSFTSVERAVKDRKGKMYIDFLQNRPQATVSAPYSVRPKPGATVSMPLKWDEVKNGLKMSDFNIHNAVDRIKTTGDLFKPVLGKGINLLKIVSKFEKLQLKNKIK